MYMLNSIKIRISSTYNSNVRNFSILRIFILGFKDSSEFTSFRSKKKYIEGVEMLLAECEMLNSNVLFYVYDVMKGME